MSQVRKTSTDIENATLKDVRHLAQTGGSFSLADILRYLSSKQLLNMADSETIVQLNLNKDVDKGLLKKLTNGKYKVNETARRRNPKDGRAILLPLKRRSRSKKRSGSSRRRRSSSGRRRKRSSSGRRRKRSSSGRRRKRSSSGRRRKRSSSGRRRKRSSSGGRRKRSTSQRRRSKRRTKTPEEQE